MDDKVIETALNKLDCKLWSTGEKNEELALNTDGKLTNWPAVRLCYRSRNATPNDLYNGHTCC